MNSEYGITPENLLRTLPEVLRKDESMLAVATTIAGALSARPEEIDRLLIYPQIDALPEELLDILAYDFKVDWWDADYALEEKRRTLKNSWSVHRRLGTKYSVETALGSVFPNSRIEEWFEYGGEPYMFRIIIDADEINNVQDWKKTLLRIVDLNKNIRSHLEPLIVLFDDCEIINRHGFSTRNIHRALLVHPPQALPVRETYRITLSPFNTTLPTRYNGTSHYDGEITWAGYKDTAPYPFPVLSVNKLGNHNIIAARVPVIRNTAPLLNVHTAAFGLVNRVALTHSHDTAARAVNRTCLYIMPETRVSAALRASHISNHSTTSRVVTKSEITNRPARHKARLTATGEITYSGAFRYDGTAYWDGKTAKYEL